MAVASLSHNLFYEVFCLCFLTRGFVLLAVFALLVSIFSVFEGCDLWGSGCVLGEATSQVLFFISSFNADLVIRITTSRD